MPSAIAVEKVYAADGTTPIGARVIWGNNKPPSTYTYADVPATMTTAAAVEAYLNEVTRPQQDPNKSRLGDFLNCYAWARVKSFVPAVSLDVNVMIGDEPFTMPPATTLPPGAT